MAKSIRKLRQDDVGVATTVERTNLGNLMHIGFSSDSSTIVKSHFLTNEELKDSSFLANLALIDGYEYLTGQQETSSDHEIIKSISNPFFTEKELNELKELNESISNILTFHRLSMSSIESCTGGAWADFMTNNFPYYENTFNSTWVVYDEESKEMLGVPSDEMKFGMVYSERVAGEMANALKKKSKSDIIIATTGVMEAEDTREYHNDYAPGTIYVGILVGQELKTFTLKLELQRRDLMKKRIIKTILYELLGQLKENKKIEGIHKPKLETPGYTYW